MCSTFGRVSNEVVSAIRKKDHYRLSRERSAPTAHNRRKTNQFDVIAKKLLGSSFTGDAGKDGIILKMVAESHGLQKLSEVFVD